MNKGKNNKTHYANEKIMKDVVKDAKKIMDDFAEKLKEIKEPDSFGFEADETTRDAKANSWDLDFQEQMLKNAPRTKDDCIMGEKKHW